MFVYDDGGRNAAGYKGDTGDCVCRAIAIATGMPYQKVYDLIGQYGSKERIKGAKRQSHARTGVFKQTTRQLIKDLGWTWVPVMGIGTGCKMHLKASELPKGTIICKVSKHVVAVINGVIHDTYDCSRNGTRCVYGYYTKNA